MWNAYFPTCTFLKLAYTSGLGPSGFSPWNLSYWSEPGTKPPSQEQRRFYVHFSSSITLFTIIHEHLWSTLSDSNLYILFFEGPVCPSQYLVSNRCSTSIFFNERLFLHCYSGHTVFHIMYLSLFLFPILSPVTLWPKTLNRNWKMSWINDSKFTLYEKIWPVFIEA